MVDLNQLNNRREFLLDIGAKPLSFKEYASVHLPKAFNNPNLKPDKKWQAIQLLAIHLGEIMDGRIQSILSSTEIVLCKDKRFYKPDTVYFDSQDITDIIGPGYT